MATFGTIRKTVEQRYPGVSADLRDQSINDHYRLIFEERPWRGLQETANLQTTAEYTTGTLAVTNGSTTITGTGTTFTSGMTGREIRIDGRDEFYTFTFVSSTSGTLDRAYEGTTDSETTYRIFVRIYSLASDISVLESIKRLNSPLDMDAITRERLDEIAPSRPTHGEPNKYAHHDYDSNDRPTVELYPIPIDSEALVYRYSKKFTALAATSDTIPEWIPEGAITEAVMRDMAMIAGNPVAADRHAAYAEAYMGSLRRKENRNTPGSQMQMASRFVRHRNRRGS